MKRILLRPCDPQTEVIHKHAGYCTSSYDREVKANALSGPVRRGLSRYPDEVLEIARTRNQKARREKGRGLGSIVHSCISYRSESAHSQVVPVRD
jgi:hypothetical protein